MESKSAENYTVDEFIDSWKKRVSEIKLEALPPRVAQHIRYDFSIESMTLQNFGVKIEMFNGFPIIEGSTGWKIRQLESELDTALSIAEGRYSIAYPQESKPNLEERISILFLALFLSFIVTSAATLLFNYEFNSTVESIYVMGLFTVLLIIFLVALGVLHSAKFANTEITGDLRKLEAYSAKFANTDNRRPKE